MFYDEAKIFLASGNGGDGMISFRREKYVPRGGPDGGDGGKGGSIRFRVNPRLNSLTYFHGKVHFKAEHGGHGTKKNQTGANGADLVLEVPPGTVLRDAESGELLADLTVPDREVVILAGGSGGRGNSRFATATHQAPRLAERGEPGKSLWVTLELKLIADVGLVGKPNAGKSTLLSAVSAARPKIGAYPFTTLQPNLGVVALDDYETFVMADIPGLIEGAADGVGLGHDFLRHIERTRLLIHLLDGAAENPLDDWAAINRELARYNAHLEEKPQLVVLNKLDLPDAVAWEPLVREQIEAAGQPFHAISAVTGQGVRQLIVKLRRMLDQLPPAPLTVEEDVVVIRPQPDPEQFSIEQVAADEWRVHGLKIERIAAMTYFEFDATARRFQRILEAMGITEALREAGVQDGHLVHIGSETLEWQDE